jgi:FkbM family methyltransferase
MGKNDRKLFSCLIKDGMRVVDVGANIGLYSFLFSTLIGAKGSIVSFEPEPGLFGALQHNCKVNNIQNISLYECAIGNDNGEIAFQRSALNSGDNRIGNMNHDNGSCKVRLARLDDAVPDQHVDFVKIDVQGHELSVFTGMQNILASNPNVTVYFEFWPDGMRQAGSSPQDALDYLKARGLRIYQPRDGQIEEILDFKRLIDSLQRSSFTNLIATKNALGPELRPLL